MATGVSATVTPVGTATDYKPIVGTPTAATTGSSTTGAVAGQSVDPNAFAQLQATFDSYGLSSLVPDIKNYLTQGYNTDTINLLLQQTSAYQQRFAGNTLRAKNGLAVLSPADYLSMESSYNDAFRQYLGSNASLFNSTQQLAQYIGNDVSASEMQQRLQVAHEAVTADNPQTQAIYQAWYGQGLTQQDAIAAVLDPEASMPTLQRKANAAMLGSAAVQSGLGLTQGRAEQLSDLGADVNSAVSDFGKVAAVQANAGTLASRYGLQYGGQQTAENAVFFNDAQAQLEIGRLGNAEQSSFAAQGNQGNGKTLARQNY